MFLYLYTSRVPVPWTDPCPADPLSCGLFVSWTLYYVDLLFRWPFVSKVLYPVDFFCCVSFSGPLVTRILCHADPLSHGPFDPQSLYPADSLYHKRFVPSLTFFPRPFVPSTLYFAVFLSADLLSRGPFVPRTFCPVDPFSRRSVDPLSRRPLSRWLFCYLFFQRTLYPTDPLYLGRFVRWGFFSNSRSDMCKHSSCQVLL